MSNWFKPKLDWLLIFVPITVGLEFSHAPHTWIFGSACLAILPLAGWMGRATEHLAERTGAGIGGLLNATFGNAAELIIALMALRAGLYDVVKASLTGSIIGNILLVLGLSMFCGGLRNHTQNFNLVAARNHATMLMLAAVGLILPAAFHHWGGPNVRLVERDLSLEIAVVLILSYGAGLLFSLHTHKSLFSGEAVGAGKELGESKIWTAGRSVTVLVVVTALVAWMSEILVGSVEQAAETLGMTELFLGVVVVAIIGNAAEHSSAILVAMKDRMDLALGIAIGSSVQIALFVAPLLVFVSYFWGPRPMDLVFQPSEVLAVALGVLVTGQVAGDGECNWFEGLQLLAVYAILGVMFYFLPAH